MTFRPDSVNVVRASFAQQGTGPHRLRGLRHPDPPFMGGTPLHSGGLRLSDPPPPRWGRECTHGPWVYPGSRYAGPRAPWAGVHGPVNTSGPTPQFPGALGLGMAVSYPGPGYTRGPSTPSARVFVGTGYTRVPSSPGYTRGPGRPGSRGPPVSAGPGRSFVSCGTVVCEINAHRNFTSDGTNQAAPCPGGAAALPVFLRAGAGGWRQLPGAMFCIIYPVNRLNL